MKVWVITIAVYAAVLTTHVLGAEISNGTTQNPLQETIHEKRSIGLLGPLLGLAGMGGDDSYSSGAGLMGIIGSLLSNRMGMGSSGGGSGSATYSYNDRPVQDHYASSSNQYASSSASPGFNLNLDFGRIGTNLANGIRFGQTVAAAGTSLLGRLLQLDSGGGYGGAGINNYPSQHVGAPPRDSYHEPQRFSASPYGGAALRRAPPPPPPHGYGRERIPMPDRRIPTEAHYRREPTVHHDHHRSRGKPQEVYEASPSFPERRPKPPHVHVTDHGYQGFRPIHFENGPRPQSPYPNDERRPSTPARQYADGNGAYFAGHSWEQRGPRPAYPDRDNEISNNFERTRSSQFQHSTPSSYHQDDEGRGSRPSSQSSESSETSTSRTTDVEETAPIGVVVKTSDSYVPANVNPRPAPSEYDGDYNADVGHPEVAVGETRIREELAPGEGVVWGTDATYDVNGGGDDLSHQRAAASNGGDAGNGGGYGEFRIGCYRSDIRSYQINGVFPSNIHRLLFERRRWQRNRGQTGRNGRGA